MDSFVSDFLYAFRVLFKRPGLTLLAIVALSVSLGMSTTAFSTLNGMFFKPLPFKDPESLHQIYLRNRNSDLKEIPLPYEHFEDLKSLDSFSDVMGYYTGTINVSGKGVPVRYEGGFMSPNFLDLLGHEVELGRSFSTGEELDLHPGELLISYKVWKERFHADPDVLGTKVRANGNEHVIVGVLPDNFHFPNKIQVWMPLHDHLFNGDQALLTQVYALGRIKPGVSMNEAQDELASVFKWWTNETIEEKENLQLVCHPFGRMQMNKASNSLLLAAMGAVIFVLLVSCANVANLLVGRALTRGREMAIRSAIGATRGRIIRQLLTESLLLSFLGAVGGLLYAAWAVDASMSSSMYQIPYWMDFELDWRVFAFVLGVMVVTALVSGLIPAWQASKIDLNEMLKDTSHTSTSFRLGRMTRLLAVVQIAFSCALLFGAGLITRNVYQMSHIDPGYPMEDILTMRMGLFPADYPEESDRDEFYSQLLAKLRQSPGIKDSAVTSWIGHYGNYKQPFIVTEDGCEEPELAYSYSESVSPSYFNTFGLEPVEGRLFSEEDNKHSAPVAIVNEAFVNAYFNTMDPIGCQIGMFVEIDGVPESESQTLQIIGVVPTIRVSDFTEVLNPEPIIYMPYTQTGSPFMSLVVNSPVIPPDDLEKSVQNLILKLDPNLPVYFTNTMVGYVENQIYPYRMLANFFLTIGLMALFLAAIGVYGMLAFNVSRRRREIGIRMALGANTLRIVSQVLRQGFLQVVVGVCVGTGLAYLVGQLTRGFLFGVNPADPSVYAGVLLTLVGVATLAFFLPARRAARLSPMEALRYE